MHRPKRWKIETPDPTAAEALAARLKVSNLVAQVLINRGIHTPETAAEFLSPTLLSLPDPNLLPGVARAAARIASAIAGHEPIVIYGDYDVDGITATSILWHAITLLGGVVKTYIPHRLEEGYGLNCDALRQIIDEGARLIVTVDCGITAIEPAKIARDRGIDLIITDHHECHRDPPVLPDCYAIVHPRMKLISSSIPSPAAPPPYPNPHLCGAGVAFKLAWGIGKAVTGGAKVSQALREFLVEATALAALGTIADVVPLVGENRNLAHFGLSGLKASNLTGIKALIESADLTGRNLDSYDVGFLLAPRLNACGRMGHAALAVEMLTTATAEKATEIATFLASQNRARQALEREIFQQAVAQVEANGWADDRHRALVLGAEDWHAGVIGIVASRIVERFCRPTVMIALSNGTGQGSARSVSGFHLTHALEACGKHLLSYGGHEMAAGLKLETARLEEFREAFAEFARTAVTDEMLLPQITIDAVVNLSQITEPLVRDLQRLAPFGQANRRPILAVEGVTVASVPRRVGKDGDHLQIMIRQGNAAMKCIAFKCGDLFERLTPESTVSLAVEPCVNEFNGRRNVELEVKDFRFD
jgi:single-stranded-DNA-specific exonuclease